MRMRDATGNLLNLDPTDRVFVKPTPPSARKQGWLVVTEHEGVVRPLSPPIEQARAESACADVQRALKAGWPSYEIPAVVLGDV